MTDVIRKSNERCRRAHLFAGDNFFVTSKGSRACKACRHGFSAAHKHGRAGESAYVQKMADEYYAKYGPDDPPWASGEVVHERRPSKSRRRPGATGARPAASGEELLLLPGEQWRPVVSFEGFYEVSSLGRVWSWHGRGRYLSLRRSGAYKNVSLQRQGERPVTAYIHRLVAEAFHGPCPEGQVVRHEDGNAENNSADNLEYGTPKANVGDQIRHGTHSNYRKTRCKRDHLLAGPNLKWSKSASGPTRKCVSCWHGWATARRLGQPNNEVLIRKHADERYQREMGDWETLGGEAVAAQEAERAEECRKAQERLKQRFGSLLPPATSIDLKLDWTTLERLLDHAVEDALTVPTTSPQAAGGSSDGR